MQVCDRFLRPNIVAIIRMVMLIGYRLVQIASARRDWIMGEHIFLRDSESAQRTFWLSRTARAIIDATTKYGENCQSVPPPGALAGAAMAIVVFAAKPRYEFAQFHASRRGHLHDHFVCNRHFLLRE